MYFDVGFKEMTYLLKWTFSPKHKTGINTFICSVYNYSAYKSDVDVFLLLFLVMIYEISMHFFMFHLNFC